MDRSSPPNADRKKTSRPEQQGNSPSNQEKTRNLTRDEKENNTQHHSDPSQGDSAGANLSPPPSSHPSRGSRFTPVDRLRQVVPGISHVRTLTHDNLKQLQTRLADPTPMARWEIELVQDGVWNGLGQVAARKVGQTQLPKCKRAASERDAGEGQKRNKTG